MLLRFSSTDLWESTVTRMMVIKEEQRNPLDADDVLRLGISNLEPRINHVLNEAPAYNQFNVGI